MTRLADNRSSTARLVATIESGHPEPKIATAPDALDAR
jgi:hypothetical protein